MDREDEVFLVGCMLQGAVMMALQQMTSPAREILVGARAEQPLDERGIVEPFVDVVLKDGSRVRFHRETIVAEATCPGGC